MIAEEEGKAAAEEFRRRHRLGHQPLGDLVALIEQTTDIDVAVLDVARDEHGMAMRDPERDRVFLAVARTPHPMRQRSSLAHELAHVLFGDWNDLNEDEWARRDRDEIRADTFARHLLAPEEGLKDVLAGRPSVDLADLSAVVQRFLVSPAMASIALHQAGLIDGERKADWMSVSTPALAARFGWTDQYRALADEANRTRAPQRLLARAVQGYLEHVVSLRALARLRGVTEESLQADLLEAGLVPPAPEVRWAAPRDIPQVEFDLSGLEEDAGDPPE
ncbi:MAG TPA: ImmA/IrrE family metallo-endopeptidase [Actinomycetota bacterium]|nr:ImmA/IrrE family metallo-endopeptidase [Actinomycetota bacterium]